jgi:hypothetical protein
MDSSVSPLPVGMSLKAAFIVALFLSRYPPDDQISRLTLRLWTSTGKAESIAVMLRHTMLGRRHIDVDSLNHVRSKTRRVHLRDAKSIWVIADQPESAGEF